MEKKVGFFEYIFTDKKKHGAKEDVNFSDKFEILVEDSEKNTIDSIFDTVEKDNKTDLFRDLFGDLEKEEIETKEEVFEETIKETVKEVFDSTNLENEKEIDDNEDEIDDKDKRLLDMLSSSKDNDTKDFFEELKEKKEFEEENDTMSLQDFADSLDLENDLEEVFEDDLIDNDTSLDNLDSTKENFGDFDILDIIDNKEKVTKEDNDDKDTNLDIPMI